MSEYNGSSGQDELTDCGVFVATVMRMSGADPDYARRGTSVQMDYLRSSGKYDLFDNLNNEGQLQPGDIFIIDGHTYLYTGNYEGSDGRTYNAASASLARPRAGGDATCTSPTTAATTRWPGSSRSGSARLMDENRRLFMLSGTVVVIALVVLGGYLVFRGDPEHTLTVKSIPNDLTLTLDGQQVAANGEIKVKEGKHTLTGERPGFQSYTQTVQVTERPQYKMFLFSNSAEGRAWEKNAPGGAARGRGRGRPPLRRAQRPARGEVPDPRRSCRTSAPASR